MELGIIKVTELIRLKESRNYTGFRSFHKSPKMKIIKYTICEGSLIYPQKGKEVYRPLPKMAGNEIQILFSYLPLQFHQLQGFLYIKTDPDSGDLCAFSKSVYISMWIRIFPFIRKSNAPDDTTLNNFLCF